MTVFMGLSAQQICVVNGGIFPVLAGPAGTLGAFLAITTQPLITVCGTVTMMTAILGGVFFDVLIVHN